MKSTVLPRLCTFFLLFYFLIVKTAAQSISGVINNYCKVTNVNTVTNSVTVSSAAGLSQGIRVLVIQMKGASFNSTNSALFGDITAMNTAGYYEYNTICSIASNIVLLEYPLQHNYDVTGNVQLVTVPQYHNVKVTDTLKCSPWNSTSGTGGVLVLQVDTL